MKSLSKFFRSIWKAIRSIFGVKPLDDTKPPSITAVSIIAPPIIIDPLEDTICSLQIEVTNNYDTAITLTEIEVNSITASDESQDWPVYDPANSTGTITVNVPIAAGTTLLVPVPTLSLAFTKSFQEGVDYAYLFDCSLVFNRDGANFISPAYNAANVEITEEEGKVDVDPNIGTKPPSITAVSIIAPPIIIDPNLPTGDTSIEGLTLKVVNDNDHPMWIAKIVVNSITASDESQGWPTFTQFEGGINSIDTHGMGSNGGYLEIPANSPYEFPASTLSPEFDGDFETGIDYAYLVEFIPVYNWTGENPWYGPPNHSSIYSAANVEFHGSQEPLNASLVLKKK